MKNQSKIEELLAESLKKQDQMLERMDKHENILNKIVSVLETQTSKLIGIGEKIEELTDLRDRIKRIEKHVGLD